MVYVVRHRRRRLIIHLTAASVAMASSRLSRCCCLAFHASTLAFQSSLNGHHPPILASLFAQRRRSDQNSNFWAQYKLRQSYQKSGGILYKQSILTPDEFTAVQNAIFQTLNVDSGLKLSEEKESSFATNRIGAVIYNSDSDTIEASSSASDVYRILSCETGSLCQLVNSVVDHSSSEDEEKEKELGRMILSPDIPIEIRIYEKMGAGMEWHVDDIIYENTKQIEVVLTLENTSDCCTMWKPHDRPLSLSSSTSSSSPSEEAGAVAEIYEQGDVCVTSLNNDQQQHNNDNNMKYRIESVQSTPNSALLIQAGSVEHKVSSLSYGRRVILKMAFVREGALIRDEMREHMSHHLQQHRRRGISSRAGGKNRKKEKGGGSGGGSSKRLR